MPSIAVAVINESLDSAVERGLVFLWPVVNILVFYRFPKSFNPNVVFGPAATVHALIEIRYDNRFYIHENITHYHSAKNGGVEM